jgi:hypothetical protein
VRLRCRRVFLPVHCGWQLGHWVSLSAAPRAGWLFLAGRLCVFESAAGATFWGTVACYGKRPAGRSLRSSLSEALPGSVMFRTLARLWRFT